MDKIQKSLIDTYYRKRAIAAGQSKRYKYLPYEYSKYALDNKIMDFSKLSIGDAYENNIKYRRQFNYQCFQTYWYKGKNDSG